MFSAYLDRTVYLMHNCDISGQMEALLQRLEQFDGDYDKMADETAVAVLEILQKLHNQGSSHTRTLPEQIKEWIDLHVEENVKLEQLCESLLQFEPVWEKQGIEIDVNLAEGVRISADAELLSLVWNNLLSNAFKFTRQGGTVGVILTADSQYATVQISDTGCGMSPEVGAHIFEKFYQGDASHATQGNGLGLALVKRVVDIMGGEICVESAPEVGSTFTVKIRRNCHEGLEQDL